MRYGGNDNYGHPKQDYIDKLQSSDDFQLSKACGRMIWLSAYADNNPLSDYHWQCDACYDECIRRDKGFIYDQEHHRITASLS